MSYESALIAAGAEVLEFAKFGDYSGEWFAKVRYNGETGWIQDWYGSCSYCDAFQAEFDWDSDFACEDTQVQLANFGRVYLDDLQTTEQILAYFAESADWDSDSESALYWIRETEQTYRSVQ